MVEPAYKLIGFAPEEALAMAKDMYSKFYEGIDTSRQRTAAHTEYCPEGFVIKMQWRKSVTGKEYARVFIIDLFEHNVFSVRVDRFIKEARLNYVSVNTHGLVMRRRVKGITIADPNDATHNGRFVNIPKVKHTDIERWIEVLVYAIQANRCDTVPLFAGLICSQIHRVVPKVWEDTNKLAATTLPYTELSCSMEKKQVRDRTGKTRYEFYPRIHFSDSPNRYAPKFDPVYDENGDPVYLANGYMQMEEEVETKVRVATLDPKLALMLNAQEEGTELKAVEQDTYTIRASERLQDGRFTIWHPVFCNYPVGCVFYITKTTLRITQSVLTPPVPGATGGVTIEAYAWNISKMRGPAFYPPAYGNSTEQVVPIVGTMNSDYNRASRLDQAGTAPATFSINEVHVQRAKKAVQFAGVNFGSNESLFRNTYSQNQASTVPTVSRTVSFTQEGYKSAGSESIDDRTETDTDTRDIYAKPRTYKKQYAFPPAAFACDTYSIWATADEFNTPRGKWALAPSVKTDDYSLRYSDGTTGLYDILSVPLPGFPDAIDPPRTYQIIPLQGLAFCVGYMPPQYLLKTPAVTTSNIPIEGTLSYSRSNRTSWKIGNTEEAGYEHGTGSGKITADWKIPIYMGYKSSSDEWFYGGNVPLPPGVLIRVAKDTKFNLYTDKTVQLEHDPRATHWHKDAYTFGSDQDVQAVSIVCLTLEHGKLKTRYLVAAFIIPDSEEYRRWGSPPSSMPGALGIEIRTAIAIHIMYDGEVFSFNKGNPRSINPERGSSPTDEARRDEIVAKIILHVYNGDPVGDTIFIDLTRRAIALEKVT